MVPIPLRDVNPTRRVPIITISLILINALCWVYQIQHGVELSTLDYGLIPAWLLAGMQEGPLVLPGVGRVILHQEVPHPFSIFSSMFMHGSWLHIIGNMWFLWIFGDNVEDEMGRVRYLLFYLLCGVAAALAQVAAMPDSTIPMVGASGAIAGILGGYILLHPHARVLSLWVLIIYITMIEIPAWVLLGLWFVSQFFIPMNSGVAWVAHVGGFVAGAALVIPFVRIGHKRAG
jgi:membrane associated rhomboid family serine protease